MKRVLILIAFIVTSIDVVNAECSNLATAFSTNPDSMDVDDLASLKKCVTSKLREKLSSTLPVPTPSYAPPPKPAPRLR